MKMHLSEIGERIKYTKIYKKCSFVRKNQKNIEKNLVFIFFFYELCIPKRVIVVRCLINHIREF